MTPPTVPSKPLSAQAILRVCGAGVGVGSFSVSVGEVVAKDAGSEPLGEVLEQVARNMPQTAIAAVSFARRFTGGGYGRRTAVRLRASSAAGGSGHPAVEDQ